MNPNSRNNRINIGTLLQGLGAALQNGTGAPPRGPRPARSYSAPPPPPHQRSQSLPKWMGNLDVKCTDAKHFAPMPTTFVKFTHSDKGHPVAQYKCSCGRSQFFALNPQGKAFCLFTK